MRYPNDNYLSPVQVHFLRSLFDGKREISEKEAAIRSEKLGLSFFRFPCVAVLVSPYYTKTPFEDKDAIIEKSTDYVSRFLSKRRWDYYCLSNTYDNIQVLLPTSHNGIDAKDLENVFIELREELMEHTEDNLFIGIGSVVESFGDIARSFSEAMEMLAYKYQYADRGVINIINTQRFKPYSLYGQDILYARVLGRFQDGDLAMMEKRLDELTDSMKDKPGNPSVGIKRTYIELAVDILHIASNANVEVDSLIEGREVYTWILQQDDIDVIKEWLMELSSKLLLQMQDTLEQEEREVIQQACDYINQNLQTPDLSVQMVSEQVGLSSAYFGQLFKAEKGIGPNNYIAERRLEKAKTMLTETTMKTQDIALQLGFSSATYFGRVFKKYMGLTPNEYRTREGYKK